ncbi:S-layer homology domain-containing protein [Rothia aerolata]|uniref:SLH domain-containing protein n=1 Tax=Rothia aerolata TaxID=1812262 RepID=A0A917MVP7_9MICC|nr:S-layer homology domain-containing protein [Rothia aerolata]GGH67016.1 hypothetical protein GCM10007359_21730 [Rothia aerolata]
MLTRRATLAAALLAALGLTLSAPPSTALTTYSDIKPGTLFYTEMTWAINKTLLPGYPDGTFRPDAIIDRQTFAQYFVDTSPTTEFYKEICWLRDMKIATGWNDGTYKPLEPIERYAVCAFLYRYHQIFGF